VNRVKINTPQGRSILLLGGEMKDIEPLLPATGLFIITDTNVHGLYGSIFPPGVVLTVEPGEQSKTLGNVEELCSRLLEGGADRSSFILGFGGGVVCDLAGMTASVYMRGVRHAFVSTSLLSQVDASTGGKTAVDLGDYKNIIGTFKQPEFVLCDHRMLSTLPEEEMQSGLGELIKHAVIRDRNLFFDISAAMTKVFERDPVILADLIGRAVRIKASVVRRDPLEEGLRRVLNFGHTFGHVMETCYRIPHGVAVTKGMLLAAELSVWTGDMPHSELRMLESLIEKTGMLPELELPANLVGMMSHDKKAEEGSVNMVLLREVGRAVVKRVPLQEISAFVDFYREDRKANR
jgi:3-dehydroquinate synthase